MFLLFGYGKLTAFAGTAEYMGSLGVPAPSLSQSSSKSVAAS
jgi:uncharacterized membrane protein YphA (DoxX/SURF4 family)